MASTQTAKKDVKSATPSAEKPVAEKKTGAALEEDDEFEDFPVDDWSVQETEAASGENTKHLWEESWDDDDTSDDFSTQLKEELKKVDASKKT